MTPPVVIAELRKSAREAVRVSISEFQGRQRIDVRIVAKLNDATGLFIPTPKGISLPVEDLPTLVAAMVDAEKRARGLGLIGGAT